MTLRTMSFPVEFRKVFTKWRLPFFKSPVFFVTLRHPLVAHSFPAQNYSLSLQISDCVWCYLISTSLPDTRTVGEWTNLYMHPYAPQERFRPRGTVKRETRKRDGRQWLTQIFWSISKTNGFSMLHVVRDSLPVAHTGYQAVGKIGHTSTYIILLFT